jgi:hypothetical protein
VKAYSLEQAVRAQKALRDTAGLGAEMFPVHATRIAANSNIQITAAEIAAHYASLEERRQDHD